MISVKTFMHQKQTLAKISGPEIMFAETHQSPPPPNPEAQFSGAPPCGVGGGVGGGAIWWPLVPKSPLEHTIPEILQKSLYYWSLDSERAGSRTLEKF
jgi:hypothetical protein